MTTMDTVKQVAAGKEIQQGVTLKSLLEKDAIRKRFEDVLGTRSNAFMSSLLSIANNNKHLVGVDPVSLVSSAMMAATLDLPINQSLGFAHIVPYKGKAQFQMGWKGFVQLAMRTGQYKTMNASPVYAGELVEYNRVTGDLVIDYSKKSSDEIVGYASYFKLINGFEKYFYMRKEELSAHGQRYSKSYGYDSSVWKTNFDAMALKTVLKLLLSKYGILSVEMQKSITADQAVIKDATKDEPEVEYIDSTLVLDDDKNDGIEPPIGESK